MQTIKPRARRQTVTDFYGTKHYWVVTGFGFTKADEDFDVAIRKWNSECLRRQTNFEFVEKKFGREQ
jgi:hypothetical protein